MELDLEAVTKDEDVSNTSTPLWLRIARALLLLVVLMSLFSVIRRDPDFLERVVEEEEGKVDGFGMSKLLCLGHQ